jgi:hypothetical protein
MGGMRRTPSPSGGWRLRSDSAGVNERGEERAGETSGRGGAGLRPVRNAMGSAEPPPPVRLVREWKGPTVADLLRDEFAARLPGEVRSALRHLEAGELAAAEASLPGEFGAILPGPAAHRRRRSTRALLCALGVAVLLAALVAWANGGW